VISKVVICVEFQITENKFHKILTNEPSEKS